MKVELTKKDVLNVLQDLEAQLESQGNYVAAVSLEIARAALKRFPKKIVYVSPANHYIEATIVPESREESNKE